MAAFVKLAEGAASVFVEMATKIAEMVERGDPALKEAIRECYRATFGACSRCNEPLTGPSPPKLCTDCHAAIVLEKARGAEPPAEA